MANHWATHGISQAEEGRELRLDPCHLPQSVTYIAQQSGRKLHCSLTERAILLRSGAGAEKGDVLQVLSLRQFRGIAARRVATKNGRRAISLVLLHPNPDYCVPLLISVHYDDVLLDWRLWSDIYDLPMLIIDSNGIASNVLERTPLRSFFFRQTKKPPARFLLRCRGRSLHMRLTVANQVMLG